MGGALLAWAREAFAGEAAVDALSAGRSCGLSAVDKRQDKRVVSAGLAHAPRHGAIAACLGPVQTARDARHLTLTGLTTDGSARSPEPLRTVFGEVPPQRCTCPVLKALPKGIGHAVAKARERLAQSTPKGPRGRPSSTDKDARRLARKKTGRPQNISDVCHERFLVVTRRVKPRARPRLLSITRGLPPVRTLREIMAHLSALFDRRCRTPTALGTLKKLRQWVRRCTWMGET